MWWYSVRRATRFVAASAASTAVVTTPSARYFSTRTLPRHELPVSAWRKNSRNKLAGGDVSSFETSGRSGDADELLCQVGAEICRRAPGVLPRKELFEARAVAQLVHTHFPSDPLKIAELCAGCGLLAIFLVLLNPLRRLRCLDRRETPLSSRLLDGLSERWPVLGKQIQREDRDLRGDGAAGPAVAFDSLVVSCHACGTLTDEVIAAATDHFVLRPCVLVPCCHPKHPALQTKQPWRIGQTWDRWPWLQDGAVCLDGAGAVDEARQTYLASLGYDVVVEFMDDSITKQNRAIVARPR